MYKGSCPICNKAVIVDSQEKSKNINYGYIYQGKIKRYFHLTCLDMIKRGKK